MSPVPPGELERVHVERRAVIGMSVPELEDLIGASFWEDIDDLGEVRYLPMRLSSGPVFVLNHYVYASPEVELWVEPGTDLDEVASALGIPRSVVQPTLRPEP